MRTPAAPAPARRRAVAGLALLAALGLAGCGSEDAGESDASATPSTEGTSASATERPSESPSASASATGGEEATDGATTSPDASSSTAPTEPTPQPAPAGPPQAVTGDVTETTWGFHLPVGEVDACQFMDGSIYCFFAEQSVTECSGDSPMAQLAFDGTSLNIACSPVGEAGVAPHPGVGAVIADPEGTYRCELVDAPSVGVRCTSQVTGRTALLTGAGTGLG